MSARGRRPLRLTNAWEAVQRPGWHAPQTTVRELLGRLIIETAQHEQIGPPAEQGRSGVN
jgi:hypothetical protein